MVDVKEERVCIKLVRVGKNLTKCLNKHLVVTLWVRRKPVTDLRSLKMAESQLTMTKGLDDLQPAQRWKNVTKVHEGIGEDRRRTIHDVCKIVGLSHGTCQRILSNST
jgi:hypothetical protein